MKVKKIVLTGGPCAGKTTALQQIEREFTEKGYHVLIVPEAASILIGAGNSSLWPLRHGYGRVPKICNRTPNGFRKFC